MFTILKDVLYVGAKDEASGDDVFISYPMWYGYGFEGKLTVDMDMILLTCISDVQYCSFTSCALAVGRFSSVAHKVPHDSPTKEEGGEEKLKPT